MGEIVGTYGWFDQCAIVFVGNFSLTSLLESSDEHMLGSLSTLPPWMVPASHLAVGMTVLFAGFILVRPISFVLGAYLGWKTSLVVLLTISRTYDSCKLILGLPVTIGMLCGALAASRQRSMFVMIGVITGAVIGSCLFNISSMLVEAPEHFFFTSIGFFAVVVRSCNCWLEYRHGCFGVVTCQWLIPLRLLLLPQFTPLSALTKYGSTLAAESTTTAVAAAPPTTTIA